MSVIEVNSQPSNKIQEISFQTPRLETSIKKSYRIVLERDEDGRIVVTSPDLQGVATDGIDKEEALRNAIEAIDAVIEARGLDKEYNLIEIHKKHSV